MSIYVTTFGLSAVVDMSDTYPAKEVQLNTPSICGGSLIEHPLRIGN